MEEEEFKEKVAKLWGDLYGNYRVETELWWEHYDSVQEQIMRHKAYLEQLPSLGFDLETEYRYRSFVARNLRIMAAVNA